MQTLPLAFDLRGKPVALIGKGEAADAKARLIAAAGGIPVSIEEIKDLPKEARVAFVAEENADIAKVWVHQLHTAGLVVNVVDNPELCDFQVPAILDRGLITVAISTGGASASLAKALRERLEAFLPNTLGTLAETIGRMRSVVAERYTSIQARRAFWDQLLAPGGLLDPLGEIQDAENRIKNALTERTPCQPGQLITLTLTSLNPADITLGQLRSLQQADLIVHLANIPAQILDMARRDAPRIAFKSCAQHQKVALEEALETGKFVVLITLKNPEAEGDDPL